MDEFPDILDLLKETVRRGGSDLHLSSDSPPLMRLNGVMVPLSTQAMTGEMTREIVLSLLTENQRSRLEQDWELDFAMQVDGVGRFRGNAHYSRGALEAALRFIPDEIPDLLTLGHSEIVSKLCELESGLVIVGGATGSGKSTTLAAMVKLISEQRSGVIVTVEDPIEFVFRNALSIVKQREVGNDTHTFDEALRRALRQDPDVIMVGELRDKETIAAAVTAAETGHLVLGSLHATDAPGAFTRMVDVFPPEHQAQVIAELANSVQAVVCQRLLPKVDGQGRALASEVIVRNSAVRAVIRDRKWEQLVGLIEIGSREGMHTFDDSLIRLYESKQITKEEAILNARDKGRFEALTPKKKGFFS